VAEIRRAYRGIAMLYHPDLNPGDRSAAALFRAATDARDMLLGRA
jgi:molecular chaperone DnaJ